MLSNEPQISIKTQSNEPKSSKELSKEQLRSNEPKDEIENKEN